MDRQEKEQIVSTLKEEWKDVMSIVLADARGIDVPTITSVHSSFSWLTTCSF